MKAGRIRAAWAAARAWWPRAGRMRRRMVGLALVAAFGALLVSLWHPVYRFSALLWLDAAREPVLMPAVRAQPSALNAGGYDGQFYAQIACDPTLRDPALVPAVDTLAYRARRIGLPATAWALARGDPERAVRVFPWLNIGCWIVLGGVLWPLLRAERGWIGVVAWAGVMFSGGMLASVRYALTDLPALLLLVLAVRAAERRREGAMAGWFAASLLTRETILAGAWSLLPVWPSRANGWLRRAAWLAAATMPLVLWLLYIRWRVGPLSSGLGNFAWPGTGFLGEWREELAYLLSWRDPRLGVTSTLALVSLTAQAVFLLWHWRPRNRWWRLGAGSLVLLAVLGGAVWEGVFGASLRVLLPLLLVCNYLAVRRRRAVGWLLLLNLSVPAGLVTMTPQPDTREVVAGRSEVGAVLIRGESGCYGWEADRRSRWTWTQQDAVLAGRCWLQEPEAELALTMEVRALDTREIVISADGGELWRGTVNERWTVVAVPHLPVRAGEFRMRIHSDSPGRREAPDERSRLLSVCLLNPEVVLRRRTGR